MRLVFDYSTLVLASIALILAGWLVGVFFHD